jgi:hypothetical protein
MEQIPNFLNVILKTVKALALATASTVMLTALETVSDFLGAKFVVVRQTPQYVCCPRSKKNGI